MYCRGRGKNTIRLFNNECAIKCELAQVYYSRRHLTFVEHRARNIAGVNREAAPEAMPLPLVVPCFNGIYIETSRPLTSEAPDFKKFQQPRVLVSLLCTCYISRIESIVFAILFKRPTATDLLLGHSIIFILYIGIKCVNCVIYTYVVNSQIYVIIHLNIGLYIAHMQHKGQSHYVYFVILSP